MQAVIISLKGKSQRPYASADSVSWIVTQNNNNNYKGESYLSNFSLVWPL